MRVQNQMTNITLIVPRSKTWIDIADRISPTISEFSRQTVNQC